MSLFEHFLKGLSLYLVPAIWVVSGARTRIKKKIRIRIRIRIK
jgi:hypothetical protein